MTSSTIIDLIRQTAAGLRLLLALTVVLGVLYPVAVWALAQPLGDRAAGQPLREDGRIVGSRLLGQQFDGDRWFQGRPSANAYDSLASGPSNLGPSNLDLLTAIAERRTDVAAREGVDPARVPADALTASGSGLDPHISADYARLQAPRVARENDLPLSLVEQFIAANTDHRPLGFLGEDGVNVVALNLDVDRARPATHPVDDGGD
ncbi:potassium-transporting ATPase subunit KdpC [Nocardioides sp. R-C-SC26]|uniref:potassium-transporting ATPase subunit KdpC n=1 Tax=Nocardioides sp. R-C-SC26 TaxID=2870414 RepID=UPI001E5858DD|nr:potassium-transporting ATPase subunit KdpC [Nocardioides sp. R-C-SC26]